MPQRIQLSRKAGWRKPEGAIVVARPSRWGNSFTVRHGTGQLADWQFYIAYKTGNVLRTRIETIEAARTVAVDMYRKELLAECDDQGVTVDEMLAPLRGHDLACWCPPDHACHASLLIELANP